MSTFKDHFSSHAASYAAYRPSYPLALVDYLVGLAPSTRLALDCGCGTGQLSTLLAQRFARVVATDASEQQIAHAEPHERVSYRATPAESSGLADMSVDLTTVAQAAHWFDLEAFYAEVRRVLRPNGVIALITYGVVHLQDAAAERVLQHFYRDVLDEYWPAERSLVEAGYRTLPFPFTEVQAPQFDMETDWALSDLLGYVDTWSAVRGLEKAQGRGPIERFERGLSDAWGDPVRRTHLRWPLSLRVGRAPA